MTNENSEQHCRDEDPCPWSCAALQHRVATLEQVIMRHEGRLIQIDGLMGEHKEEVAALTKMNEATLATLVKMQETLELMKEVLTTYNKAKSFVSVFHALGSSGMFMIKLGLSCAALYVAFRYGKLPNE